MKPYLALAVLLAAACAPDAPAPEPGRESLARAARYLWSKQGPDGGWHSQTYGLLRSGQSLTPFVLLALLDVPESVCRPPAGAVDRAIAFIERHLNESGELGRADPTAEDYPNYATALGLRVMRRRGRRDAAARMTAALLRQQFSEGGGWERGHTAYGAWGMGGPIRTPPDTGHLDLSMTRHVLDAVGSDAEASARALVFLERCQNPDGGFIFSTLTVDVNKAGRDGERWRSYGTTTADGILALLACGVPPDDPRVRRAGEWLVRRHRTDRVPGFAGETAIWEKAMVYYYRAAAAEALRRLDVKSDWRRDMIAALAREQRADGSWVNEPFYMKEDDPLIATGFALRALLSAIER